MTGDMLIMEYSAKKITAEIRQGYHHILAPSVKLTECTE